jgi:hypothetical protein
MVEAGLADDYIRNDLWSVRALAWAVRMVAQPYVWPVNRGQLVTDVYKAYQAVWDAEKVDYDDDEWVGPIEAELVELAELARGWRPTEADLRRNAENN